jgi:hypothetical protein
VRLPAAKGVRLGAQHGELDDGRQERTLPHRANAMSGPWWPVEQRRALGSVTRARNAASRARCGRSPAGPCRSSRSLAELPSYQAGLLQARPDLLDDLRRDGRLCSLFPVIAGLGETG